jgi:hypothetical protein
MRNNVFGRTRCSKFTTRKGTVRKELNFQKLLTDSRGKGRLARTSKKGKDVAVIFFATAVPGDQNTSRLFELQTFPL